MVKNRYTGGVLGLLPFFFACEIATLGGLKSLNEYSLWYGQIAAYPVWALWLARIVALATLVVLFGLARRRKSFGGKSMILIASIALVVGLAINLYGSCLLSFFVVGQVLIGFAHTWLLVEWASFFSGMQNRERNIYIAGSSLVAATFSLCMPFIFNDFQPFVMLFIAIGCGIPLFLLQASREVPQAGKENASPALCYKRLFSLIRPELVFMMACFAFIYRMMSSLFLSDSFGVVFNISNGAINILGIAALLLYLGRRDFEPSEKALTMPLFVFAILAFLLLPISGDVFRPIAVAAVQSSWFFFTLCCGCSCLHRSGHATGLQR